MTKKVIGIDWCAGEKIDKFAMVVLTIDGDYKAPIPQNVFYSLRNVKVFE